MEIPAHDVVGVLCNLCLFVCIAEGKSYVSQTCHYQGCIRMYRRHIVAVKMAIEQERKMFKLFQQRLFFMAAMM